MLFTVRKFMPCLLPRVYMSDAFKPNNKIILKEQNTQKKPKSSMPHGQSTNYVAGSHPTIKVITA